MELIDKLQWRYATKAMNKKVVPEDKVTNILEAARLAPTSSGLQPFEIIVIKNSDLKEKIQALAWNQSVVSDCSHLLVFAAWDNYTPERINKMFDFTNEVRGGTSERFEKYRAMILNAYPARSAEDNFNHTSKQAYIAFANAVTAAAFEEVDATPIEGFDPRALDELLKLKEKGLQSCLLLPLGYRDEENDQIVNLPKVRVSMNELVTIIE